MGHMGHGLGNQRGIGLHIGRFENLRMPGEGADLQGFTVAGNFRQAFEVVDVDQDFRSREAHVQCRHQALAAGEDPGVITMLVEQVEHLIQRFRADICKWCGFHFTSPSRPSLDRIRISCRSGTDVVYFDVVPKSMRMVA